jgi:hypothetical protein
VTDVRKRSIHNFVMNTPLPRYLTSFQLKTQKESSDNLKEKVIEVILELCLQRTLTAGSQ